MVQLIVSCVVLIAICTVYVLAEELYSNRYDEIDFKAIFANDKLRNQYYKCVMDTGPCRTASMKFLKKVISEAFQTQCRKCTEKQKMLLEYMIEWYTTKRPDEWRALIGKLLNV